MFLRRAQGANPTIVLAVSGTFGHHSGGQNTNREQLIEIERKFLVAEPPPQLKELRSAEIWQGYLLPEVTLDSLEVRLRRQDDACFLTIKQGTGLCRTEVELPLPTADFEALWPMTVGRRLRKTRYWMPLGERTLELDVYAESLDGLLIAEIEFPDVAASIAFQPPTICGREVTNDLRYRNGSLARGGLPVSHPAALS